MSTHFLAVCFDHDGTLVDSEPIHYRLWRDVLAPHGVALTESQYQERYAGVPTLANAQDLVARHDLAVTADTLARDKLGAMSEFVTQAAFPLLPDVPVAIARLRECGLRLAVVTGTARVSVEATLREHALACHFETVVAAEDVVRNKPAPEGYLLAVRRLRLTPAQCVAIEDTEHGVNAAHAAGVACVAVPTAMSRHHDFSRADATFDTLPQAVAWIEARAAHPRR